MSITLTVDDETAGVLVDELATDRCFLSEAPADHAAFILFHESNTVEFLSGGYGPEREDPLGDIDLSAIRILRGVVNNTWIDNREDQLSEPLAAIIQCYLKAKTATVIYHLGDDSEAWRFNDDNFRELLTALEP